MQHEQNTQVPSGHVSMTVPKTKISKENHYTNHMFINGKKALMIFEDAPLFVFIIGHLKRPYENKRSRFDEFHDKEFILEHTTVDLDFEALKLTMNRRAYTKSFKALTECRAILKVNDNVRCHKYYVNPDYAHTLERYCKNSDSQCQIYYDNYSELWPDGASAEALP